MCRVPFKWDQSKDMPFELFTKIADELFRYAEIVDLRGWGESTMLPNFLDYVEYAAQFPCRLQLYTNLTKHSDDIWAALMRHHFTVGLSIDGATAQTFEKIRQGAYFKSVQKNLNTLAEYRDMYNCPKENILFNTVVQKQNLHEIPELIKLAKKFGIKRIKLSPIVCSLNNPNNLLYYRNEVRTALDLAYQISLKEGVTIELATSLHPNLTLKNFTLERCTHPWSHCYITSYGGVGFCDCLIAYEQYLLGNINDNSFWNIWNGDSFGSLRQEHCKNEEKKAHTKLFSACKWCYLFRYPADVEAFLNTNAENRRVKSNSLTTLYDDNELSYKPEDWLFR